MKNNIISDYDQMLYINDEDMKKIKNNRAV